MFNLFVCVSELSKLLGFFIPSLTYSSPPAISLRLLMTYLWCVSTPYTIRRPTIGSPPSLGCNSGSKSITLEKERYTIQKETKYFGYVFSSQYADRPKVSVF